MYSPMTGNDRIAYYTAQLHPSADEPCFPYEKQTLPSIWCLFAPFKGIGSQLTQTKLQSVESPFMFCFFYRDVRYYKVQYSSGIRKNDECLPNKDPFHK